MMRSLWTAASGMMAQQTSVDTISNNLANVNTVGYKSESTEFKSLLYQNLQARTTSANGEFKPVSAQVGLGARVSSITSHYTQGAMNAVTVQQILLLVEMVSLLYRMKMEIHYIHVMEISIFQHQQRV